MRLRVFRSFAWAALVLLTGPAAQAAGRPPAIQVALDEGLWAWWEDAESTITAHWKPTAADAPATRASAAASTRLARSIADGMLEADAVVFNQGRDIAALAADSGLVGRDWAARLPDHASPVSTVVVFVVRQGNPKAVHDWADLVKPGVAAAVPNPKFTTDGRLVYYAAWGSTVRGGGTIGQARGVVTRLFGHAPVIEGGTSAAAAAFAQHGVGDAVVVLEQQLESLRATLGPGMEVVYPKHTLAIDHPVAVVDKVADRHGARRPAEAWLRALWSDEAQEAAARHGLRPRNVKVLAAHRKEFPAVDTFTVEDFLGGWDEAQKIHFGDGGVYDQILLGVKHD